MCRMPHLGGRLAVAWRQMVPAVLRSSRNQDLTNLVKMLTPADSFRDSR